MFIGGVKYLLKGNVLFFILMDNDKYIYIIQKQDIIIFQFELFLLENFFGSYEQIVGVRQEGYSVFY